MIDPTKITNYNLNQYELEEHIIFWICVAGKTAKYIVTALENLLLEIDSKPFKPFEAIRNYPHDLSNLLKKHGIGCYNGKAKGISFIANSNINLKTCSVEDLEKVPWIGPKTARCFIVHSRENAQYACLDTHILRYLREIGFDTPKGTPTGKKYKELEEIFLSLTKKAGMTPAQFDLFIWNKYSKSGNSQITP